MLSFIVNLIVFKDQAGLLDKFTIFVVFRNSKISLDLLFLFWTMQKKGAIKGA